MNLRELFYRLPFRFDAERLNRELAEIAPEAWNFNYRQFKGTSSLPLISAEDLSEGCEAPLIVSDHLAKLAYFRQVLAALGATLGRVRVVRLEPGAGFAPHAEPGLYWQRRVQVHIPIQTNANVHFFCARQPVHMAEGQTWFFNNALMHRFVNDSDAPCMHLVADAEGTPAFIAQAKPPAAVTGERFVGISATAAPELAVEQVAPPQLPQTPRFERPVFIVAAPRSGSTLLFETLAMADGLWTLGGEGGVQVETIARLAPQSLGVDSNRLTAAQLTPAIAAQLKANYAADLRTADQTFWRDPGKAVSERVRFLEKTPKNALRIPFFKALFADAKFIFLQRDAKANISAIIEAWRSGKFVTYSNLPGWKGMPWSLLLTPGWREVNGAPLGKIATRQWIETNSIILEDLAQLAPEDWCSVRYEDLLADAPGTVARLCAFAGVEMGARLSEAVAKPLKLSAYTLTKPDGEKWKHNEAAFAPYLAEADGLIEKLSSL